MLRHIGLQIYDKSEVVNFYVNILNFKEDNEFTMYKEVSKIVYGIDSEIDVFRMKQFDTVIDLMVYPCKIEHGVFHIALEFWKADEIVKKAKDAGYETIVFVKNEDSTARYIKDKAGNLFELKDINLI